MGLVYQLLLDSKRHLDIRIHNEVDRPTTRPNRRNSTRKVIRVKEEYGVLCDMLARIRESFSEEDFIDDEGYDRLGACVASPVEVLAVLEMKMKRLEEKLKLSEPQAR